VPRCVRWNLYSGPGSFYRATRKSLRTLCTPSTSFAAFSARRVDRGRAHAFLLGDRRLDLRGERSIVDDLAGAPVWGVRRVRLNIVDRE
jgi:hypothetical protein